MLRPFVPSEEILAQELPRSTSLETEITVKENVERTDYVNENGEITYAANKHYATVIKTKEGNTQLDEYFDALGKPAQQVNGHYAVLREYNEEGQEYKLTYLGADLKPIISRSGYAILQRTFNKNGLTETELYYDVKGEPIRTKSLGYGCRREYNKQDRNTVITYLDQHGEPMISGQGYAILHREYYEEGADIGRVKNDFYFDEKELPIKLSIGQYGVYKEYDEFGREIKLTYLDASGNPVKTTQGYATVLRSFYNDDSVQYEFYYDINGKPVALSEGQYGLYHQDGTIHFLDKDGNELFNLRNFLSQSQTGVILLGIMVILTSCFAGRKGNLVLLFLYLLFIIYMTLMNRANAGTGLQLDIFWSYRQFFQNPILAWEIMNNIFLFIPLGTILYNFYPRVGMIFIALGVSIAVEVIQYVTGTGLCEWDDVISNGFGGATGYGIGKAVTNLKIYVLLKNEKINN